MRKFKLIIMPLIVSNCSMPVVTNTATQAPVSEQAQQKDNVAALAEKEVQPAKPVIEQPTGEWIDWPIASGDWVYRQDARGSIALFGVRGENALVTLRCNRSEKTIFLSRSGTVNNGAKMIIRTSHMLKTYNAATTGAIPPYSAVTINPDDAILDALVYTRGRFAIESEGQLSIALPSWSEIVHVIEDCR